jgi:hypothetical protein
MRIPWSGGHRRWALNPIRRLRAAGPAMSRFRVRANMRKEVAARSRLVETAVRKFPGRRHAKSRSHSAVNEQSRLRAGRRVQQNAAAAATARRRLSSSFISRSELGDGDSGLERRAIPSNPLSTSYCVGRFFVADFGTSAVFRGFSFFSRLSFHAVRKAPASRSSFAAARRT